MKHPRSRAERRFALAESKRRTLAVFLRNGWNPDMAAAKAVRMAENPRACSCALCSPKKFGMTHRQEARAPRVEFAAY